MSECAAHEKLRRQGSPCPYCHIAELEAAIGSMAPHPLIKDNLSEWSKGWITGWNSYHRELHVELEKEEGDV